MGGGIRGQEDNCGFSVWGGGGEGVGEGVRYLAYQLSINALKQS